jgi:aconitase B
MLGGYNIVTLVELLDDAELAACRGAAQAHAADVRCLP